MNPIEIRPARSGDCEALSRLALRSKGHWGYPPGWLELWKPDLTFSRRTLELMEIHCALAGREIIGCYGLLGEPPEIQVEHFWVLPEWMGRGLGRRLFEDAAARARSQGAWFLRIESDPHAEAFYIKMGAKRIGWVPGKPEPRRLPVMLLDLQAA